MGRAEELGIAVGDHDAEAIEAFSLTSLQPSSRAGRKWQWTSIRFIAAVYQRLSETGGYSPLERPWRLRSFSLQVAFTQTDRFGRDFHELIILDVFEGDFEGHIAGRLQDDVLIAAGRPHVGEFLFLADVDRDVGVFVVLADDHAFVNFVAGLDEHHAAVGELIESEGIGGAVFHGDQHAVLPPRESAAEELIIVEGVVHDGFALGAVEEAGAKADESAGGN